MKITKSDESSNTSTVQDPITSQDEGQISSVRIASVQSGGPSLTSNDINKSANRPIEDFEKRKSGHAPLKLIACERTSWIRIQEKMNMEAVTEKFQVLAKSETSFIFQNAVDGTNFLVESTSYNHISAASITSYECAIHRSRRIFTKSLEIDLHIRIRPTAENNQTNLRNSSETPKIFTSHHSTRRTEFFHLRKCSGRRKRVL
eukprot:TRINITY_DN1879_c0_g1_i1.p1 TRINITY_DN1879_c0_g1~~TRINITY_DN1879_c0_g1_i1.p1  ORF type:complete len:203 (-),score=22.41 TRINITY_DN1879_c0_g1_i1:291-899(-)